MSSEIPIFNLSVVDSQILWCHCIKYARIRLFTDPYSCIFYVVCLSLIITDFIPGLTKYFSEKDCNIFNPEHATVCEDMKKPLSYYFIASSHNT